MKPCKHNTLIGCLRIIVDHVRQVCDAPEACANYEASGGSLVMHPSASGEPDTVGEIRARFMELEALVAELEAEMETLREARK